ncbi:hypothetical protein AGDE_14361 [Angomonas deanei]|nr:hypothetical protein AGDE_14361 [Angomonas deanei]|eukprot:EPY20993.1 hypothetical protein AGDE_14361 [Angomonas deanei]
MKDVGLIDQISKGTIAGDDHHLGRSCRTDRGVHALKNVVALFATKAAFEKLGGVEGIKEKLNHALLPLVRVAQVTVVSANFIPRQCCSRRVYWYMMPLYAMVAPCDSWETLLKAHPDLSTALDHCAHGTTKEGVRFWDMNASSEAELSNPSLKLIVEKVNQCNELLQKYIVGYHRFHNFSVDKQTNHLKQITQL